MSKEIEIKGIIYTFMKMDAFSQLTLSRKGAPLFFGLSTISDGTAQTIKDVYDKALQLFSEMPEDDFNLLIKTAMPFVRRKDDSGAWAVIYNKSAQAFQYDDIDAGVIVSLLLEILLEYLPPFFAALDQQILGSQGENQK